MGIQIVHKVRVNLRKLRGGFSYIARSYGIVPTVVAIPIRYLRKLSAGISLAVAASASLTPHLQGQTSPSGAEGSLTSDVYSVVGKIQTKDMTVKDFIYEHAYEPIYFVGGFLQPSVEFQFSLKYRLFGDGTDDHIWNRVYFGYTQTSFWSMFAADAKFYDSSYKPSLFYLRPDIFSDLTGRSRRLDLQTGFEHESNGAGDTGERSLYTAYVQLPYTIGVGGEFQLTLQPRLWSLFWVGSHDSDIVNYRGHGELTTRLNWKKITWRDPIQLEVRYDGGPHFQHSGEEVILRFNPFQRYQFNPTIQVEYFNGYGDNLRDYDTADHTWRFGLCLWCPDLLTKL